MNTFDKIYTENYPSMFRLAVKIIGNKEDASDVVQEVFMYLFNQLQKKHLIKQPQSWLYKATYNSCIKYFRKTKQTLSLESINGFELIDSQHIDTDKYTDLKKALKKLKHKEKMLAVLYSEGLTYAEISEVLDIKQTSVGKMLSRTLDKIEFELKKQHYEVFN